MSDRRESQIQVSAPIGAVWDGIMCQSQKTYSATFELNRIGIANRSLVISFHEFLSHVSVSCLWVHHSSDTDHTITALSEE
jgi:hypothetical protein